MSLCHLSFVIFENHTFFFYYIKNKYIYFLYNKFFRKILNDI